MSLNILKRHIYKNDINFYTDTSNSKTVNTTDGVDRQKIEVSDIPLNMEKAANYTDYPSELKQATDDVRTFLDDLYMYFKNKGFINKNIVTDVSFEEDTVNYPRLVITSNTIDGIQQTDYLPVTFSQKAKVTDAANYIVTFYTDDAMNNSNFSLDLSSIMNEVTKSVSLNISQDSIYQNVTTLSFSNVEPALISGGLTSGTYKYRIVSYDSSMNVLGASGLQAKTTDGTQDIKLSWGEVPEASTFRIFLTQTADGRSTPQYFETSSLSYTDDGTTGTIASLPTINNYNILPYDSSLSDAENEQRAVNNTISLRNLVTTALFYSSRLYFPGIVNYEPYCFVGDGAGVISFKDTYINIVGDGDTEGSRTVINLVEDSGGNKSFWQVYSINIKNVKFTSENKGILSSSKGTTDNPNLDCGDLQLTETKANFYKCYFENILLRTEASTENFEYCTFKTSVTIYKFDQNLNSLYSYCSFFRCSFEASCIFLYENFLDVLNFNNCQGIPQVIDNSSTGPGTLSHLKINNCNNIEVHASDLYNDKGVNITGNSDITITLLNAYNVPEENNIIIANNTNLAIKGPIKGYIVKMANNIINSNDSSVVFTSDYLQIQNNMIDSLGIACTSGTEQFIRISGNHFKSTSSSSTYFIDIGSDFSTINAVVIKDNVILGAFTSIVNYTSSDVTTLKNSDSDRLHYETSSFNTQIPFFA